MSPYNEDMGIFFFRKDNMKQIQKKRILYLYLIILVIVINWKFRSLKEIKDTMELFAGADFKNYNLIPFQTMVMYMARGTTANTTHWLITNLIGNTVFFIPVGLLYPMVYEKAKFLRTSLFGFCLTLGIELFQLVTKLGSFDVDDILLNLLGVMIGYGIFKGIRHIRSSWTF